jgi:pimeloyl-ACP methyl ester carboxylesterase
MPMLERDGTEIWYETSGSGPAILLTHGYSATTAMWTPNIAALSKNHTLILWDIRGHGRSGAPADPSLYSRQLCMDDMCAVLDANNQSTAVIGGLSLGGYLSLAFNVFHGDRVNGLLIFDTGPGYRSDTAREDWNRMAVRTGAQQKSAGLKLAAEGILTQQDSRILDSLPGITIPSLVLAGANDTPFLKATEYMASRIPGARKVIIDAAGHTANSDQPQAFNEAVCSFLADHQL